MKITETQFYPTVEELLTHCGWHWYHPRPARITKNGIDTYRTAGTGNVKGFLDYIAIRPPRIVVLEIKSEGKGLTPEQRQWFDQWKACQIELLGIATRRKITIPEVYLVYPSGYDKLVEILE